MVVTMAAASPPPAATVDTVAVVVVVTARVRVQGSRFVSSDSGHVQAGQLSSHRVSVRVNS
ncbi:hypothetical protein HanRHA438_Chr15g0730881 [Helianthus annuus]|nr:hypothetical protein HanHA300_Chr15g0586011 [Helianthus annuus]KAJ0474967.1 hypothetical protein HanHA89_Chr15g0635801 [Helianthus annuus]KAJ0650522.1 hypothetical protein HanLR1_Chr15g0596711 [Helianthus annuus]KAJ0654275.1 hypothetical protein HanOQP8_Chr15g0593131 [Helianthus annuus]KAJ0846966.1 hypothetical protein HanRHA438_Chr15g0730881 [Helianthus annuus]